MEGLDKIFVSDSLKEVVLKFEDMEIVVKIKNISWSKKNQIMSQCFEFKSDKNSMVFNLDLYKKLSLVEIIKEAPWGDTNMIFLNRIKPEFGKVLETLVPKVGEEISEEQTDFFEEK